MLIAVIAIPLRTKPVDIMFLNIATDRIQLCFRDCYVGSETTKGSRSGLLTPVGQVAYSHDRYTSTASVSWIFLVLGLSLQSHYFLMQSFDPALPIL